jgi:glutamyl/glutaminyl-tRNA synthetase
LQKLAQDLPDDDLSPDAFKAFLGHWLEGEGLKMRDIGPCLRAAVTGMKQTPDIILICSSLGMENVKARIAGNCKN